MQAPAKKPSLFKQRISAVKQQPQQNGFPTAVNLTNEQQKPSPSMPQVTPTSQGDPVQQAPLLDIIKTQGLIESDDLQRIQSENWKTVEAMSEAQRNEMVEMLKKQMDPNFLNSFKKQQSKHKQQPMQAEPKQAQQPSPPAKESETVQPQASTNEGWSNLLKLDIESDQLQVTEEQSQHLIGMQSLAELVGSDNNQSQIVGSRIASTLVDLLCREATSKSRELVIIQKMPLHLGIVFQYFNARIVVQMLRKAKNSSFKSVFIELVSKSLQILAKIKDYLSKDSKQFSLKLMADFRSKLDNFLLDKQSLAALQQSLTTLSRSLSEHWGKVQSLNWKQLRNNSDIMLQLILIEQSEPSYDNSYAFGTLQFILRSVDFDETIEVAQFIYELVNKFILRKSKELYLSAEMFRAHWGPIISEIIQRVLFKIHNVQLVIAFELVFLARFVGGETWSTVTSLSQQLYESNPIYAHFVLFNTLYDQKSGELQHENIISLNTVFNWLSGVVGNSSGLRINPTYILNTVTELFLKEGDEYYSQLDQQILKRLIIAFGKSAQTKYQSVFSEEKVRTLIKNYAFNSFGNEAFTLFMMFACMRVSHELQGMILRELIGNYTAVFLSASRHPEIDSSSIPCNKSSSEISQIKSQIRQKIGMSADIKADSILLRYIAQ